MHESPPPSTTTAATTAKTSTLCGPHVMARLQAMTGETVEVVTLRLRYRGKLLTVHRRAVWLELGDDCHVAITEPIITVALRPGAAAGTASLAHPTVQAC